MEIVTASRRVRDRPLAMRGIVKACRRPPTGRSDDRNGGFPGLSDVVAPVLRCTASPRRTLLAENPGKPSPWVFIRVPWYYPPALSLERAWAICPTPCSISLTRRIEQQSQVTLSHGAKSGSRGRRNPCFLKQIFSHIDRWHAEVLEVWEGKIGAIRLPAGHTWNFSQLFDHGVSLIFIVTDDS